MKSLIISILSIFIICSTSYANRKAKVSGGADVVSSYVWRGSYNAGASIQPSITLDYLGFNIGAWGSTDFGGNGKKEVDLSIGYTWKDLKISVTDYWWAGEGAYKYFHYGKSETAHLFEAGVSYKLPFEKFPLMMSWNTIFIGADYNREGNQNYSTYIELNYPFSIKSVGVDMNAIVGFVPWSSPAFLTSDEQGFQVCNVAVAASKAIPCSKSFSIPLFSQLIFNPATEDIHIVFGLSLKF